MTINMERLKTLAVEVRTALDTLEEFAKLKKSEYLSDRAVIERVRYNFIVAIQASIDICNHVASRKAKRAPANYGDCFTVLKEAGFIDGEVCKGMKRLTGLRNILVHLYWQVDDEHVFTALQNDLGIIRKYLDAILLVRME